MKRSITLLIFLGVIMLFLPLQAFAGNIDVYVDGNQLTFDSPPIIDSNRTLVPFRQIFEALGADVSFDAATQTAIGIKDNLTIRLPISQSVGYINNEAVRLDVASKIVQGRTMVPLRFISENLGYGVESRNLTTGMVINITGNTDGDDSSPVPDPDAVAGRSLSDLDVQTNDEQFVLELAVEKGQNNSFTLSNPNRLVIDLEDTAWQKSNVPGFDSEFVSDVRVAQYQETTTRVVLDLKQTVAPYLDQQDGKLIITLKPKAAQKPDNLVVLDAGHGGDDVGAIGVSGAYEKNLVIGITQLVKEELTAKGFDVIMTRDGDQTRSLAERVEIANQTNAFAFVSIHANSATSQQANGLEVYTKRGSDHTFAKIMVDSVLAQTGQYNRGDREADFYVIKNTVMPAILVETGFISNPQEEQFLWNKANQQNIAKGIVDGIISFKSKLG